MTTRTSTTFWRGIRDRVFDVRYQYKEQLEIQRARTLVITSVGLSAFGVLAGLFLSLTNPRLFPFNSVVPPLIGALLAGLLIYALVQAGLLRLASYLFVATLVTLPIAEMWYDGLVGLGPMGFTLPVVAASLLLGTGWGFVSIIPSLLGVAAVAYKFNFMTPPAGLAPDVALQDMIARLAEALTYLVVVAVLAGQFNTSMRRWAEQAQRRAQQLEAAALVSEAAATAPSVGTLLNLAVERIREAFGFYHAQVFLLDQERRMARLEASTGRAGVALLARGHSLPVGSRSVIGQATYVGKPVVINNVRTDPMHRPNDLLPDTRAELALPLIVGGEVIGALDVQSTAVNVFGADEVNSLQVMANQLAGYVEKARLLAELQARTSEQQYLIEETQSNLRQIEDLNRRLTREGWSDYLRSQRVQGTLGFTLHGGNVDSDSTWTAPMRQAFYGEQSVVIRQDQQAHIAALPLKVRGEVIGVLEIERDGSKPWNELELEMAETLIQRLAVAVENARLYEQATLAAEREHVVNRIAQDVQEAESVDQVLQAALTELSSLLGASRGVVQIQAKDEGDSKS